MFERLFYRGWRVAVTVAALGIWAGAAFGQAGVLTQHNDNRRTGANLQESTLTPAKVSPATFGKLFSRQVDGEVYAQPLYMPSVPLPGGPRNVVFVATMNNTLYAFDADDPAASAPLWSRNFGTPIPQEEVQCCCRDISTKIGILGTPVIDPATNTLYVVSRNKPAGGIVPKQGYQQWIRAIDVVTGADRVAPRVIHATYRGIAFDSKLHNQRAGLTLHNGSIYVAWASHNDCGPYHGWVMRFRASDLSLQASWNSTPQGSMAGVWQSGQGLTVGDDGFLYLMTGNGTFNASSGGPSLGCSFVKLDPNTLSTVDWYTPSNVDFLNAIDADLGSAGVLALPGTSLITGVGKEGRLYLIDRNNMGGFAPDKENIVQAFGATNGHVHGSPIYYKSPENGASIYVWSEEDRLKVFAFDGKKFNPTPAAVSLETVSGGMPGAMLSISATGGQAGSAILWATHPRVGNANQAVVPGMLRAYDISTYEGSGETKTLHELWNSESVSSRDRVGNFAKFSSPTIANGKVYLATFGQEGEATGQTGQLLVYGLLGAHKPVAPANLKAVAEVRGALLSWNAVAGAERYNLYRGTAPGGEGATPYLTGLTALNLTEVGLSENNTYYYQVSAVNAAGEGPRSQEVSVRPLAPNQQLQPVGDTYVDSVIDFPYGRQTNLSLKSPVGSLAVERVFLQFDLSALPNRIEKVTLSLYGGVRNGSATDTLYRVKPAVWNENALTWASQPTLDTPLATFLLKPNDIKYYTFDVTAYIQAERAAGRTRISFGLTGDSTLPLPFSHSFNSKEASGNRPRLDIQIKPLQ